MGLPKVKTHNKLVCHSLSPSQATVHRLPLSCSRLPPRMGVYLSYSCVHMLHMCMITCTCLCVCVSVYSLLSSCPLSVSQSVHWAFQCTGGDRLAPNESIWDRLGEVCVSLCVVGHETECVLSPQLISLCAYVLKR